MCTDELIKAVKESNHDLKLILITHFGSRMLKTGPEKEAERIMEETGVKAISATDGLRIDLGRFAPKA